MDDKMIKITYNQNDVREFPIGITLKQISNCFERDFKYGSYYGVLLHSNSGCGT